MLREMHSIYKSDPDVAVRGQAFIKILHKQIHSDLEARIDTKVSRKRKILVKDEVNILGSHKTKDVDVSVIDPFNGPLMMVGVRSQMSSIGKNVLTYYEEIIGDCISLQDRFPMTVIGYVYLMPLHPIKPGLEKENVDHIRYARLYDAIAGREGQAYKDIRGIYDQFAYMIVDFAASPPVLHDELLPENLKHDLKISTFIERMIETFKSRNVFLDVFT